MQRQGKEKQLGVPASCGWALRELYGLLGRGTRTPETAVEDAALPANIAATTGAIERLRSSPGDGQRAMLKGKRTAQLQGPGGTRDPRETGFERDRSRKGVRTVPSPGRIYVRYRTEV